MRSDERETIQRPKLSGILRAIAEGNAFYRRKLRDAGADPSDLAEALDGGAAVGEVLGAIPLTTKAELLEDQEANRPWGTNLSYPLERYVRCHQTSGTSGRRLVWLDTRESWTAIAGSWTRIYRAAGVGPADRVLFPFSFGPFLGFWSAFEGAMQAGCLSIPGGGMTTVARLRAIEERAVTAVAATPTYALHMAEVARSEGIDLAGSPVRALIVAGEPGGNVPATRGRIETSWGASCFDHYGMTEVGPVAYECSEARALHAIEEAYAVEVIEPGSGRPAQGGDGELVLTTLHRPGSPVLRYRTGDLVRCRRGPCACGGADIRLEGGILGRIDDMVFIRGNNVYPSTVDAVIRRFPDVAEYRVTVFTREEMSDLRIEVEPGGAANGFSDLGCRVCSAIEAELLFHPKVVLVPPGTLPRFELKARRWVKERTGGDLRT